MERIVSILLAYAILLAGCSGSGESSEGADDACDRELAAAFDAWERAGLSGAIAILDRDGFVCRAGYGWADRGNRTPNTAGTVFSIGSISKAVTAAAILDLADAGRLDLDDRAGRLVPGIEGPAARVTVRQLLHHRSGLTGSLGDDHRPLGHETAIRAVNRLVPAFEPGTGYAYSNAGYSLLALIIEEVSGTTYRDYVASHTLRLPGGEAAGGFWDGEPAAPGPRAVGHLDDGSAGRRGDFAGPHWALSGNGDLAMSMPALAEWVRAHPPRKAGGRVPGWAALDESAYGEPVLAAAGGGGDIGHEAVVAWLPRSGRVIAVATNTPAVTAEELMRAVGKALIRGRPLPRPETTAVQADPAELRAVAGRYALPAGGSFDVTATDTGLLVGARGRKAMTALFAPGPAIAGRHERRVVALLRSTTGPGRRERQALERELGGRLAAIEPVGTIVENGELRTYVAARSAGASALAWYAVDPAGGIAAASVGVDPPALRFVPVADGRYRPADPAGTGPDVMIAFDGPALTLTAPSATVRAVRTG